MGAKFAKFEEIKAKNFNEMKSLTLNCKLNENKVDKMEFKKSLKNYYLNGMAALKLIVKFVELNHRR